MPPAILFAVHLRCRSGTPFIVSFMLRNKAKSRLATSEKYEGCCCHYTKLKAQVKALLLLIESQDPKDKLRSNVMHVQIFCNYLLADSITASSHLRETNGLFGVVPCEWVHELFSTFSDILLLICRYERSSWTDTIPAMKARLPLKTCVRSKEYSSKAPKNHFGGLSSRFSELHAKLGEGTLFEFASHRDDRRAVLKQDCKTICKKQYDAKWQTNLADYRIMICVPWAFVERCSHNKHSPRAVWNHLVLILTNCIHSVQYIQSMC